MKKLSFTLFCLLVIVVHGNAQLLYGTTTQGGKYNAGSICTYDGTTQKLTAVKSFSVDGNSPSGSLLHATDGKFYGLTSNGGGFDDGTIFSYDLASGKYTQLFVFNGTNGQYPFGSLIQAIDGKLYGTTRFGGSNNAGVIFSLDPATTTFTKLYDFIAANGSNPGAGLIQAADGKLYGTTITGGQYNKGVIYSFNPAAAAYAKLYSFDGTNGSTPYNRLLQASDGKLYGTAQQGGSFNVGVIFSYSITTATYVNLYDFNRTDGSYPQCSLTQANDGKLYGTATYDGSFSLGVIFSYNMATATYTKVYDFDGKKGGNPREGLTQASDGNLYGLALDIPDKDDVGVIYSFNPSTNTYTQLLDLHATNANFPVGTFIEGSYGKLYATAGGGKYDAGVIYSFNINSDVYTSLREFGGNEEGNSPRGKLCKASDGLLYGITTDGGINNKGIIFSYNPAALTFTKLVDFNGTNGANPYAGLVQASDGKLYGTSNFGGTTNRGVIFSYNPTTHTYTKLHDFDGVNGSNPAGGLIQASDGKLYGLAGGGKNLYGVLYSFNPATATYSKLLDFANAGSRGPIGELVQATDGKLYGTTYAGGKNNVGIIFSFNLANTVFTKLYDFNSITGATPNGSLIQATNGKLYGMAKAGGINNMGVIFSYTPTTSSYTKLYDFGSTDGAMPYAGLTQASDGKLYGMTFSGGSYGYGVAFSYNPATNAGYQKLADFTGDNGRGPASSFTELSCTAKTFYKDADGDGYGDVNHPSIMQSCMADSGYVADSTDCNDADSTIYPNAPELCDGKDNNCNGQTDETCTMMTLNIGDAIVFEGDAGTKAMNFKVSLSSTSTKTVKVNYTTVNGTAKAPGDYKSANGTLTFAPGTKTQTATVYIKGDTQVELPEIFRVQLSNAVNATIGNGVGTGFIFNDDFRIGADQPIARVAPEKPATANNHTVEAYPNPAAATVNVRLNGYSGAVFLQVRSLQGKLLKSINLQLKGSVSKQLNVADLASGTYFLTATDGNGYKQTVKLVIVH